MLKKHFILFVLLFCLSACVTQNQKMGTTITCENPYILVGQECCLDRNSNGICDIDDIENDNEPTRDFQCELDVKIHIVNYNGNYKYCLDKDEKLLQIMLENDGKIKIKDWKLTAENSEGQIYESDSFGSIDIRMIKTYSFNYEIFGDIQMIRLQPIVEVSPGEPPVLCELPSLIWEEEELSEIPDCPMD